MKNIKTIKALLALSLLPVSDISFSDILVYKCVIDNIPTYQNIPCPASVKSDKEQRNTLHIRSDRNVLKSSGTVSTHRTDSTPSTEPESVGYTQVYSGSESPPPSPESPTSNTGHQPEGYNIYRFFGANPSPEEESAKPRRRFQGKELKFKDVEPRELEFRTPQPRELQFREPKFRQVQPKQAQSRGVGGKTVQTRGINHRTPQPKTIEPLLNLNEETSTEK